MDNMYESVGRN